MVSFKQWADVPNKSLFWRLKSGKKRCRYFLCTEGLGLQVPEVPELLDIFSHRSPVEEVRPELLAPTATALENRWNCYCLYLLWQIGVLNSEMQKISVLVMDDRKGLKGIGKENYILFSYLLDPCSFDGHLFQDGEDWHFGRCSKCVCRDGVTQCFTASCQALLCSKVRTPQPAGDLIHYCPLSLDQSHFSWRCTN